MPLQQVVQQMPHTDCSDGELGEVLMYLKRSKYLSIPKEWEGCFSYMGWLATAIHDCLCWQGLDRWIFSGQGLQLQCVLNKSIRFKWFLMHLKWLYWKFYGFIKNNHFLKRRYLPSKRRYFPSKKRFFFWVIFVIFLEIECCPVQPHSGHWPCYRTVSIQPIWQFDERQPSGQIEMIQHDSAVLQLKDLRIARKPIPTLSQVCS